jgi:tetratricopeptide (TPR) repeat protein
MKIMQSQFLKFPICFLILLFLAAHTFAQTSSFRLKTADSLFQAKRYTQSLEHYQEILHQNQYSPAMLLKMAYIQEGLNNIGQAMYYLNLYLLATKSKAVIEKMEDLANKYDLRGYETSDIDPFLSFYHDYFSHISMALAALTIFLVSIIFYTKIKLSKRPIASGILLMLLLITFLVHLNYGEKLAAGIVINSRTFIMDGPSAAADVIDVVSDGHRVEIIGSNDIWLKIRWNDEDAYIRNNSLKPLKL